ncbi:MAG: TIGR02147 family protein [Deltaproteobacteria bacterium]|nr:TIGR02147 family protein [Deltaproteobacteria bacterium]
MNLFQLDDYKEYVRQRIASMPKRGHGEWKKIAECLRIHTSMVSQIFKGEKELTLEQSCALCHYFGLNELETDYFLHLVQRERAGSAQLKQVLTRQMGELKEKFQQLQHRLPKTMKLTEADKALFYSHWYYSGIRLLSSVPEFHDVDRIAEYLKLPKNVVSSVLTFLVSVGLCANKNGKLQMGPNRTHIEMESPLSARHHTNWRIKALENLQSLAHDELSFTGPMSIAVKDFAKIRGEAVEFIEKVSAIVKDSEPEQLACLTLDWFRV